MYYGHTKAIDNCDFTIEKNKVTAIIGPSGCGKSTLLRSMNRMNDFIDIFKIKGEILFNDVDIYSKNIDPTILEKKYRYGFSKTKSFS